MVYFARYILAAGTATLVDIALVQALLSVGLLHHHSFFAIVICAGALGGMCTNFVLSRHYVFARDGRAAHKQFASFLLISCSTLLLRLAAAYALLAVLALPFLAALFQTHIENLPERLAYLGAVGLVTVYSFLAHKHVSFAGGFFRVVHSRLVVSR